jgi:hypothetical protein
MKYIEGWIENFIPILWINTNNTFVKYILCFISFSKKSTLIKKEKFHSTDIDFVKLEEKTLYLYPSYDIQIKMNLFILLNWYQH